MKELKLGAILFLITAICVGSLGFINSLTTPIISLNKEKAEKEAMGQLLQEADDFVSVEEIDDPMISSLYVGTKQGQSVGIVAKVTTNGYGGGIELMVGINKANKIMGVQILAHSETPGLGANAKNPSFINQFIDKTSPLKVTKTTSDEEIVAITGATITSQAITDGVNQVAEYVLNHQKELLKEGN
ncbi:electron transporter RnfG [Sporanaerobium hydrogeniformans]|uniref:Electron transporter RnfG n=1 Tax=Sporanaerobium hydrogeniformans TaxID=3072179 RepID=A0AC61DE98_9FIRM|nr:RnfABCDGE type electron transport complex subunit G [Sporanaerobium hydrogeniformans]PHV71475.1 electron transporter RnfG [Sporanaerobium hydrogeniformans]